MSTKLLLWIFLALFFILAIVFIFLYFSAQSNLINPNQCPTQGADYGILIGETGSISNQCIGLGQDPLTPACIFQVDSLISAINNCNSFPTTCQYFAFDGSQQTFFSSIFPGQDTDISYVKLLKNGI
jgi:hypothetical protein